MKLSSLIFTASVFTSATVSAFLPSVSNRNPAARVHDRVLPLEAAAFPITDEWVQRDVYSMENWALSYGAQKGDGVELFSNDGSDWSLIANSNMPAGSPVLFVPAEVMMASNAIAEEFGAGISQAEQALVAMDQGTAQRLPLFRLMIKVLAEYEKGQESPYFPWLNSLPRQFYNGAAMTGKFGLPNSGKGG